MRATQVASDRLDACLALSSDVSAAGAAYVSSLAEPLPNVDAKRLATSVAAGSLELFTALEGSTLHGFALVTPDGTIKWMSAKPDSFAEAVLELVSEVRKKHGRAGGHVQNPAQRQRIKAALPPEVVEDGEHLEWA